MRTMLQSATLAGALLTAAILAGIIVHGGKGTAQTPASIGVDAHPAGNTATSLGSIDPCIAVSTGDTFDVDIFVTDVVDLLAWEVYFVYDRSIISVIDHDVQMFQAANTGSNVFDLSESLPDLDGRYGLRAADLADPPAPDSGSGVLARLTLKAVGQGLSPANLPPIDFDGDGTMDLGPFLNNISGDPIDDLNDDGFFDGQVFDAQIAVDTACPADAVVPTAVVASPSPASTASPTVETTPAVTETVTATPPPASPTPTIAVASPTPGGPLPTEEEDSTWTSRPWVIGYVVGGLAALLVAGVGLLAVTRRRAS